MSLGRTPLLGIDVWEHAYYLTYHNLRADYVVAFYSENNGAGHPMVLGVACYGFADGHAKWGRWSQLWFQDTAHNIYEGAFDP